MTLSTTPPWQEQAPLPQGLGEDPLPDNADVVVVGAGYTGLSAARWLARTGARVVVVERHELGWGASSRKGGKALVGMKAVSAIVARHAAEMIAGMRPSSVFSEIEHPTYFFHRGRPWFRPILGATLRVMDWLHWLV